MFPYISQYIRTQPPQTIRDNYPLFLDFMTAYYEFLEQSGGAVNGILTLLSQRDIDTSLDLFLKYFEYEFLPNIPTTLLADPRKLAKHIKDFYLARGSEKSFKLLFRILYDDSVGFYYPKTDIIKPSDGKWSVDTVIRTTTVNDTYKFVGRQIVGQTSGATANVENVVKLTYNSDIVSEIYISNLSILGTFQVGENIGVLLPNNTTVYETVYGLATGIDLTNPGTGYKVDDVITTSTPTNGASALFAVGIISGNEVGRVVRASFENYPQPPLIQLSSTASITDGFYNNLLITITDGSGAGQTRTIIGYNGTQQVALLDTNWIVLPDITSHYSISLGKIKIVKAKDFGYNFSTPIAADFSLSGNKDAVGTITVGAVGQYAGRFINNDGFLSYRKYLQDSFYYQDFSYVLRVHETLTEYINVVKKLLHPAGLALFGIDIIDSATFIRKTHNLSATVTTTTFGGVPPPTNLQVQYDMIEGIDPQLLYDVSPAYPNGFNATLGSIHGSDIDDPSWGAPGVSFFNTFINARVVPINNTQQTIIVVAKANVLQDNSGLIGCIDENKDLGVTGYQIYINSDGSLVFRTQKINTIQNDLRINYPAGSINTSDYFFAALRYFNNTIVGNLNLNSSIIGSYGTNIDSTSILSNSRGYYLGTGGFHQSLSTTPSLYGSALYGSTLAGIPSAINVPVTLYQGYFDGIISYVLIYNRFLSDTEILTAHQFVKGVMNGRGIPLS